MKPVQLKFELPNTISFTLKSSIMNGLQTTTELSPSTLNIALIKFGLASICASKRLFTYYVINILAFFTPSPPISNLIIILPPLLNEQT